MPVMKQCIRCQSQNLAWRGKWLVCLDCNEVLLKRESDTAEDSPKSNQHSISSLTDIVLHSQPSVLGKFSQKLSLMVSN